MSRRGLILVLALGLLLAMAVTWQLLIKGRAGAGENQTGDNETGKWRGLEYQGYFEVFDLFISKVFARELESSSVLPKRRWETNSAHIANAASQSNLIVVPLVVENPRAYFYDPNYLNACVENGLKMVLFVNTLSKYVYFYDPRPCSEADRKELLVHEMRWYEKRFRPYRDDIVAIYVYDEPWVYPLNVTRPMLLDIIDAAKEVFWGKPVVIMFHRQGNTVSYRAANGSTIRYDRWLGRLPEAVDIVGVNPYFYSYHDDQPPSYHHTGDQSMVERDVSWACSFGKPVMLVGQAFDPGSALFFDRDNTDPQLFVHEGFENWSTGKPGPGWIVEGRGIAATNLTSYRGNQSLLVNPSLGSASALLRFQRVHSLSVGFRIAVDFVGSPSVWFALGNEVGEPVRLGVRGRDLVFDDGTGAQVINVSVDVRPGVWHSLEIRADVDADRWTVYFDGDPQTRLPNAVLPTNFSHFRIVEVGGSSRVWLDELNVKRGWSQVPLNEEEMMLYYQVAKAHPQVSMLLWWNYPESFASSLLKDRDEYQVSDMWKVQREIWGMIR